MNNFITNISRQEIIDGTHEDAGENSMLIQIVDFFDTFPEPKYNFKYVLQFKFDDIETGPTAISDRDAGLIADALLVAKERNVNVVVHCFAGLCRSGAVVDVGVELGFNPPDRVRLPNTLVRQKLRKCLGMSIDKETSMFAILEPWMYD